MSNETKMCQCPKCGMTAKPTAKFCIKCGISLREFPEFAAEINKSESKVIKQEGDKLIKKFKSAYKSINNNELNDELDLIIDNITKIYSKFSKNLDVYDKIKPLVNDITGNTLSILEKYKELDANLVRDSKINKSVENILEECGNSLDELYKKLFEDDVMDIDVNIEMLKARISMAGIQKSDFDI